MKTPSDALFRLIKAMTKGEKSSFKKAATQAKLTKKKSANYIKLFDAISNMSEYNEAALLKKFKQEAFTKNFVETKQYLKMQILKSLRNSTVNNSILFKLRKELLTIEILTEKEIFDLARTRIRKALKIAQKYELINYIFELQKMECDIALKVPDYKYIETYVSETIPTEQALLEKQKHIQYYWHRHVTAFDLWKKHGPMQPKEAQKAFDKYPLDSFHANHFCLMAKLNVGRISNDIKEIHTLAKASYELFQKHPEQISFNTPSYINSIIRYCNTFVQLKRLKEGLLIITEGIDFLETITQQNKIAKGTFVNLNIRLHSYQLLLYLQQESKTLLKEHYLVFKQLVVKEWELITIPDRLINLFKLLFSEVLLEEWESAEVSYQLFDKHKKRGYRNDMETMARLLGIIIYYETKNQVLLEISVNAAYQFIRTKEFLFEFPRQFLNFFKYKMINAVTKAEQLACLLQFKSETLDFFEENPTEAKVLEYFDFIAWINSKIDHVSIYKAYYKRLEQS